MISNNHGAKAGELSCKQTILADQMMTRLKRYIVCLVFWPSILVGQSGIDKIIPHFEAEGIGLEEAIVRLSKLSGVNISFSPEIIPTQFQLNINIKNKTTLDILSKLIRGTEIRYAIVDGQIVLFVRGNNKTKYLISGVITDAISGEGLLACNVYSPKYRKGTSSNVFGYYALYLPEGRQTIVVSYLGYKTKVIEISLYKNQQIHLQLEPSITLDEITIFNADSIDNGLIQQTTVHISEDDLQRETGLGGEDDIASILQRQAGVQTGADGIGGLSIRGGSDDQNLHLVDGSVLYYPSHLFGVYAMINSNALKRAKFSKNDLVIPMGKRLSSVVDIRSKIGNLNDFGAGFSINPSTVKARVEGPIVRTKSSYLISARRSLYLPVRVIPVRGIMRSTAETTIDFNDLNINIHIRPNERNRFMMQFFTGSDTYQYALNFSVANLMLKEEKNYHWSNSFGALHWTSFLGPKVFLKSAAILSWFHYDAQNLSRYASTSALGPLSNRYTSFRSRINDIKLRTDFDYYMSTAHFLQFGLSMVNHRLSPQFLISQDTLDGNILSKQSSLISLQEHRKDPRVQSVNHWEFYLQDHISVGNHIRLNLGVFSNYLKAGDKSILQILPKMAIQYRFNSRLKWSLYVQRSSQFFHKVNLDLVGYPNSLWIPYAGDIEPKYNWLFSTALASHVSPFFRWTLEAYYSRQSQLLYVRDSPFLDESVINQQIIPPSAYTDRFKATSYGIEMSTAGHIGIFSYSTNYTWSKSKRALGPRVFQSLSERQPFDRLHNLNTGVSIDVGHGWRAHLIGTMGSGSPATYIFNRQSSFFTQKYRDEIRQYEAIHGNLLKPIKQLNLNIHHQWAKGIWQHHFGVGVYNLFNTQNELYRLVDDDPGIFNKKVIYPVTSIGRQFILSYRVKFNNVLK